MPRDGTETYILPFPDVVADTTIESAVYNNFTNDIAQDLNNPRPITAGGTGATSAAGALAALGGETATQVVTNYDSYVFKAGSFYSAAGATGAATVNAFSGIVYLADANNIVTEARDSTTGILYVRRKVASVWGAWTREVTDPATFLLVAGGQTTTGGFAFTSYSIGNFPASFTPNPMNGNYQYGINNGAFTFNAPTVDCAIDILITNGASAAGWVGAGFTVASTNWGDPSTNTVGHKFIASVRRIGGTATIILKALQ